MPDSETPAARVWVTCNGCGASADLLPGQAADPDAVLECPPDSGCCQEPPPHSHAGDGCDRTINISASAHLVAQAGQG